MSLKKRVKSALFNTIAPYGRAFVKLTKSNIELYYWQYVMFRLGIYRTYIPCSKLGKLTDYRNIYIGHNTHIARSGCYIQGLGAVYIGNYVMFARNIGVISSNHNVYNLNEHLYSQVIIGDHCWIGMNSVILPGVKLGRRTIVGSGSVVTKSFPEGYCIIGGNPAKIIKRLDKDRFVKPTSKYETFGYIPKERFNKVKHRYLNAKIIEAVDNGIFNF